MFHASQVVRQLVTSLAVSFSTLAATTVHGHSTQHNLYCTSIYTVYWVFLICAQRHKEAGPGYRHQNSRFHAIDCIGMPISSGWRSHWDEGQVTTASVTTPVEATICSCVTSARTVITFASPADRWFAASLQPSPYHAIRITPAGHQHTAMASATAMPGYQNKIRNSQPIADSFAE